MTGKMRTVRPYAGANGRIVHGPWVGSLPLSIQAKLLRVLQEREFERLGSTKIQKVNFRLIASTNTDLKALVNQGRFRDDLYYRIAKAIVHIPPLRERKSDIPLYVFHFLKKANESFGSRVRTVSERAMYRFLKYNWPGNVRELINILEQAVLRAWGSEELQEEHLPEDLSSPQPIAPLKPIPAGTKTVAKNETSMKNEIEKKERELICYALSCTKGNKTGAASLLDIPRSSFYEKIKKYQIKFEYRPML
jgi:transcriptional regulator with PAS, ATPase and Fis domain